MFFQGSRGRVGRQAGEGPRAGGRVGMVGGGGAGSNRVRHSSRGQGGRRMATPAVVTAAATMAQTRREKHGSSSR